MADDIIGGFFKGVDKFLGGTGGESVQSTGPQYEPTTGEIMTPVTQDITPVTQEVSAPVSPVVPENYTNIQGADEQGTYRAVITDTSTPANQTFVESYVNSAKTGSIDRIGYIRPEDIGDSKTQELVRQGYSPLQATALQRDKVIEDLVSKGYTKEQASESKAAMYYTNEAKKATDSIDAMSASKHHDAMKSGLPTSPNEFEHAGDLARQFGYKLQGVSNVPGTQKGDPLLVPFKGSFLEDANIITKTQRTGETGDYGKLPLPFSSTLGSLDVPTQQAIGRRAAASALASGKEGPQSGWKVDEHIMDKYTPELAKGAGFNLAYKEAKGKDFKSDIIGGDVNIDNDMGLVNATRLSQISKSSDENAFKPTSKDMSGKFAVVTPDEKSVNKTFSVELDSGDVVTRNASDYVLPVFNKSGGNKTFNVELDSGDVVKRSTGDYEVNLNKMFGGGELAGVEAIASKNIKNETSNNSENIIKNAANSVDVIPSNSSYKPVVDTLMGTSGVTIGGYSMATNPMLNKVPGHYGNKKSNLEIIQATGQMPWSIPWATRKPKKSLPSVKRQPKPVSSFYRVTNEQIIPQTIGKDFFKYKVGSPTTSVKPSQMANFNKSNVGLNLGVKLAKNTSSTIKTPKLRSIDNSMLNKGVNMSVNVNSIMKKMSVKKPKVK